jgi:membrane protein HdeD
MEKKNTLAGILSIILGIILIISPVVGVLAVGLISGVVLLGAGAWLLVTGLSERKYDKSFWIIFTGLGVVSLLAGIIFLLNLSSIASFGIWTYIITGIILILAGVMALFVGASGNKYKKWAGIIGVLIGIIYLIVGYYAVDPLILGIIIGVGFLIYGILNIR